MSQEQYTRDHAHSWGSVQNLLLHIMNAEWIWLRRWQGESPRTFPPESEFPTVSALRNRWMEIEVEMRDFVAEQTEGSLHQKVAYTTTLGESREQELWQMMAHVPNHGTHHRGELAAMFAALGIQHQEDDWLYYFLERGRQ